MWFESILQNLVFMWSVSVQTQTSYPILIWMGWKSDRSGQSDRGHHLQLSPGTCWIPREKLCHVSIQKKGGARITNWKWLDGRPANQTYSSPQVAVERWTPTVAPPPAPPAKDRDWSSHSDSDWTSWLDWVDYWVWPPGGHTQVCFFVWSVTSVCLCQAAVLWFSLWTVSLCKHTAV